MARRARWREQREPKACLVPGCMTVIEPWKSLCDPHFHALPGDTKRRIHEAREAKAVHIVASLMAQGAAALAARQAAAAARTAAMLGEKDA